MFKLNPLYVSDGYKVGHARMLAPGTTRLYGTWIPRSLKYAPKGVTKIVSSGHQMAWRAIHDIWQEYFFKQSIEVAIKFGKDMSSYLGQPYDATHFEELHTLGYLPMKVKALPEGIETLPNIPHQTFINTVDGYAWLTLYLETAVSSASWKNPTSATIALQYRRNVTKWVMKTDSNQSFLIPYLCHDFSARGLDWEAALQSGLGHAFSFRGSDTLTVIDGARYYYGVPEDEVCINSVNASEHSVSTTKIFTVGEKQMIIDWLKEFPTGILSIVADTFDLWKLLVEYLQDPEVKELILAREAKPNATKIIKQEITKNNENVLFLEAVNLCKHEEIIQIGNRYFQMFYGPEHDSWDELFPIPGKLVIRPDSGDPVDIICGKSSIIDFKSDDFWELYCERETFIFQNDGVYYEFQGDTLSELFEEYGEGVTDNTRTIKDLIKHSIIFPLKEQPNVSEQKGVIEILWDIFGGTTSEEGYKVLDSHIGCIYGDSITLERQVQIYERLAAKGFAATNIVLGVGSFTYQMNTRDTLGFAAKGAWFEVEELIRTPTDENTRFEKVTYNIYKDPVTDDGTKKSLKGLQAVHQDENGEYYVQSECTPKEEEKGLLQVIYEDGNFYNQITLEEIRERINKLV